MTQVLDKQTLVDDKARGRLRLVVRGVVQGVGFRPFVYRLATELGLAGWVNNSNQGVFIEVEGPREDLEEFLLRVPADRPPRASIQSMEPSFLDPVGYARFEIQHSRAAGKKTTLILPDIATCPDCRRDIFEPDNRRYGYPFTNCTNCGPRFSIIEALPYDRPNTTMKDFVLCQDCRAEYENPLDRRFHAQPNACPRCGPHLELWDGDGRVLAARHQALFETAAAIRRGGIAAIKGLGGFHLVVDARNQAAVARLRQAKNREEKPFALMYPDLELVREHCRVSELEERLLGSSEAPIVLLQRRDSTAELAARIAPRNPYLGIMLPYTPLHHLLMAELGFPIVATSGNLADEPICIDEREALQRLKGIGEVFLVHNRPIRRHVDDSIVRVIMGRELVLRRARGYAPLPVHLSQPVPAVVAVGAHLKSAVSIAVGQEAFVSQHLGDLETSQALMAFRQVTADLQQLYGLQPETVACDQHPDYLSTQYARDSGLHVVAVQHHYAHVLSCMAENQLEGPVLGVSWDGTGYGTDSTIWGGEFLCVKGDSFERAAHLRKFRLPGGEQAIKEPRRAALGVLYEVFGDELFSMPDLAPVRAFSERELQIVEKMLRNDINAPITSSAGRLFDAVSAIAGLRQHNRFEGQGAMELEFCLQRDVDDHYDFEFVDGESSPGIVDWAPLVRGIVENLHRGLPAGKISARFHNTLAEAIVAVARMVGRERVVLTGGCFQNRYLTERAVQRLQEADFRPYWHQRIPPNDGGIALGQIAAVARSLKLEQKDVSGCPR